MDVLDRFHPVVATWFRGRFGTATEPQTLGWPEIQAGRDTLIAAPTGSGKTLAAFLAFIDQLAREGSNGKPLPDETRVVYVSPLKALGNDIKKNLAEPLTELREVALKSWAKIPEIRSGLRTGDTTSSERQSMLKRPPHILITTPESLYLLLTSEGGREMLSTARSVIVDEIHAVARDKRGAHLMLSLERLDKLCGRRLQRVGLSATQRPIEEIGRYLVGTKRVAKDGTPDCAIVDFGHRRQMDIAVEITGEELAPVASKEHWGATYDRVVELVKSHKSTLIFVNTRRMVERVTHALAERLGDTGDWGAGGPPEGSPTGAARGREAEGGGPGAKPLETTTPTEGGQIVAAHHGSLSKETRLRAEAGLKDGTLKAVVATASLELGIDVGAVDLVCQLGSTRSFAVGLQRIGRSGHWRGGVPKGRIFPASRDELIEACAFVRGVKAGELEKTCAPEWPLDVLSQQIVAESSCRELDEKDLLEDVRSVWMYRNLPKDKLEALLVMLSEGIETTRGRRGAWLHRDGVYGKLRGRRGARLSALSSGGAIPDTFTYAVVKEPEGVTIGSLDEDFAVESMSGDIFLLGNSSWRIRRVEAGAVRVEDAHGAPPTIPFWLGEAPGRSFELSGEVSRLRKDIEPRLEDPHAAVKWLMEEANVPEAGAAQAVAYLAAGKATLGALPTQETLIAERFFDEGGGMQLVLHAPFGQKLNRAFGLALRKRFCAGFDFELQAAATDDGILLSLGPQHSFPLESVWDFLSPATVKETLEQAVLASPLFGVRWRWNATRALALLRQMGGERVPPPIQRMRSEDLLGACFHDLAACFENVQFPIQIPEHPLVFETMRDVTHEAMDLPGLIALLERIRAREVTLLGRDTPTPSPLSHEILNSMPYTFLDDAPLEERRARAVATRRTLSDDDLKAFGALDEQVIASVVEQAWPDVRDADEMHDVLLTLGMLPGSEVRDEWRDFLETLQQSGRAAVVDGDWVAAERRDRLVNLRGDDDEAVYLVVRGWMGQLGPVTIDRLARRLRLPPNKVNIAIARIESQGLVLQGKFTRDAIASGEIEYCDRDLLARIHRRSLQVLRKEIEAVTTADFLRFLLRWQHVHPGTQTHQSRGVAEVIAQLQGLQLAASAWESEILPRRVQGYKPEMLDELCLNGTVAWGRLLAARPVDEENDPRLVGVPPPGALPLLARSARSIKGPLRRQSPHRNTSLALMLREDMPWLLAATAPEKHEELGSGAKQILELLSTRGAMFFNELMTATNRVRADLDQALWELVAAGEITCDGFAGVRTLIDPQRRREKARLLERYPQSRRPLFQGAGGRWTLLRAQGAAPSKPSDPFTETPETERMAMQYLRRWGVVFRDLVVREPGSPAWRQLLRVYRRAEARGEIRSGRFVDGGFVGEQFALPEALDSLRAVRRSKDATSAERVTLSAVDPLNLTGVITPGPRVPAVPANRITYVGGVPVEGDVPGTAPTLPLH